MSQIQLPLSRDMLVSNLQYPKTFRKPEPQCPPPTHVEFEGEGAVTVTEPGVSAQEQRVHVKRALLEGGLEGV